MTCILALSSQSPVSHYPGDEQIYHLILREATSVLTGIHIWESFHAGRLVAPEGSIITSERKNWRNPIESIPNAQINLSWAQRALHAIRGEEAMLITWEILPHGYRLSFH